jgi:RHS repeat-associated protein
VDARGGAGTIFMGYDGLDRPIWRNTSNSPTGAYDTYSYDSTANGSAGLGRLTSETFATGSLSGGYAYSYDGRGQQTASTLTVGGSNYPLGSTYDDGGNVLTQAYPDGQTITNSYTAQGWLSGVSTTKSGVTTTLASNLAYTGAGGAFGEVTAMHLGGGYDYSATYDPLDRASDLKTRRTSDGTVMFDQSRTFDGAGNVTTTNMTMPGATDNQSFCYDEQDRLTWASSATVTPPCGGSNTAGTLTAAQYTQTFSYDVLGRLTSGPLGAYTYGSGAHVHAATGIGTSWTSAYDTAGNMTCRAPSSSSTCAGTQTGAQLGYNNEGELASWQNAPSSPSTTAQFLYDGQGQRVEQSVTQAGATTTTAYVGNAEEVSTIGGTTTTTAYYYAGGKRLGVSVNGVVSYLASDGLGSATVTLNGSGIATAAQLFAPYGGVRYSSGTMPTAYGFTGQRSDAVSGLDYYGARYYDPTAGQFTSADGIVPGGGFDLWGLSRYAYVEGNPLIRVDPTGHINLMVGDDGSAAPIQDAFSGSYSWGVAPVSYHRAWPQPYRPPSRPKSQPATQKAPEQSPSEQAQAMLRDNLKRVNAIPTSQLLAGDRDNWSSFDTDTSTALAFLSMGGSAGQWCDSARCSHGMQTALQYVDGLRTGLALGMTLDAIGGVGFGKGMGGGSGDIYVKLPNGATVYIPNNYTPGPARTGNGIMFRPPGETGNAGAIRIMPPGYDSRYPTGYFRYYNAQGQPLDINGGAGAQSQADTHFPL